ncbi:MAG TPA: ATP-binding protein, partial [Fimbriimonas sp.]
MSPTDDLVPLLKKLRLSGVLQTLDLRTKQAVDGDLSHSEFLYRLLADEVERRDSKQLSQRVRRANFEHAKTIDDFEFHFNPSVAKAKVLDLATCAFVERHENVLIVGPTGVGKSHIAQALGHRACLAGHQVLYVG